MAGTLITRKLDNVDCRAWAMMLDEAVAEGWALYERDRVRIVRLRTRAGMRIVKSSPDVAALRRAWSAHQTGIQSIAGLHVPTAIRIGLHADGQSNTLSSDCDAVGGQGVGDRIPTGGWLCFLDDHLSAVRWTTHLAETAITAVAALHCAPSSRALTGAQGRFNGLSHTPNYRLILDRIQCWPELERILHAASVSHATRKLLGNLHRQILQKIDDGSHAPVLCHGDLHWGNFMQVARTNTLYVIDWEFLHVNSPWFDLFQMLDATSPFAPLRRPIQRLHALKLYYSLANPGLTVPSSERRFILGYLRYAAAHLMWILLCMKADQTAGRFDPQALERQRSETIRGCIGIARTLQKFGALGKA